MDLSPQGPLPSACSGSVSSFPFFPSLPGLEPSHPYPPSEEPPVTNKGPHRACLPPPSRIQGYRVGNSQPGLQQSLMPLEPSHSATASERTDCSGAAPCPQCPQASCVVLASSRSQHEDRDLQKNNTDTEGAAEKRGCV